jgi:hypothetical protein
MSCCGNKKDINIPPHNTVRATKVYGSDNTTGIHVNQNEFKPIPQVHAPRYSKITKQ